ncbi:MAG: patatin family protein [Oscillospiraceae bacterium]|nr:patatin family protein [Oscillospiraceae bacterium]
MNKTFKFFDNLPSGRASDKITEGCLVLEGGAWKGLYTVGVLDAMMENDLNFRKVTGCSAGALSAIGYLAGQIGWGIRIDLSCRHDGKYIGLDAYRRDKGITGFSYLFRDVVKERPLDKHRLNDPSRQLAVSATNLKTGKLTYFEKGKCSLSKAIQASATVPYVSAPVMIKGEPYLDGGCAEKIPYSWAKESGEKKIVVVLTREKSYRRKEGVSPAARLIYGRYPEFVDSLAHTNARFNAMMDELEEREQKGEIFIISPSKPVNVSRFEGDIDKLSTLYWLGYYDAYEAVPALREYLNSQSCPDDV